MNILEEIAGRARERVSAGKLSVPIEKMISMAKVVGTCPSFEDALRAEGISFICEVKKASPSKGIIAGDFPYLEIASDYEKAGAAAISVLTEPFYFKGENRFLWEIAEEVDIPILRKDFTVDSYMIYEAKALGASAVLLICSILDSGELKSYIELAHELGLSALVEAHDEAEILMAIEAGARIIGVNNRDLKSFKVDMRNSIRLRRLVPGDIIFVSESGIQTAGDVAVLNESGVDAVLIGETLMRSKDKKAELDRMKGGLR